MPRPSKASRALNQQLTDLAFIAPRVITRRVARVAASGGALSKRDQRELSRMSSEKVMAAWESWAAMASYSFSLGADMALAASTMWLPGLPSKRLPSAQDAAVKLASAGVRPYRRIAAANDRRLAKAKR